MIHLRDGVSQRNGNRKGQTLGDSHHNDSDCQNECFQQAVQTVHSEHVVVIYCVTYDAADDQSEESQKSHGHAEKTDRGRDALELLLEGS